MRCYSDQEIPCQRLNCHCSREEKTFQRFVQVIWERNTGSVWFMSWTKVLPGNGFGVPDIYVSEGEQDEDTDRLFLDSDGDYGEETCED